MLVNITKAEYDAIMFCREQVTGDVEATFNEGFVNEASEACHHIDTLRKKYLKAVAKQNRLTTAKQAVKKLHPELKGEVFNKLVRIVAKQLNEA